MSKQLAEVKQQERQVREAEAELAVRRQFYQENAPKEIRRQLPEIFGDIGSNEIKVGDLGSKKEKVGDLGSKKEIFGDLGSKKEMTPRFEELED